LNFLLRNSGLRGLATFCFAWRYSLGSAIDQQAQKSSAAKRCIAQANNGIVIKPKGD